MPGIARINIFAGELMGTFFRNISIYVKLATWQDYLDVLIVAVLLYQFIKFVRGTGAERLLKGLVLLLAITLGTYALELKVMYWLLSNVMSVGLVALVIIFQPELRKALEQFGRTRLNLFKGKITDKKVMELAIVQTIEAVSALSWEKTGALIVFERGDNLTPIAATGTKINADVNAELLKNIFYPKAPLHDGAVVISGARVEAAGCILPLSNNMNISKDMGTRHRAAIGMSESYDSISIVVSEETGSISFCMGGTYKRHQAPETLLNILKNELIPPEEGKKKFSLVERLKGGKKE